MNGFDKSILLYLNGLVGRWPHLETFITQFQSNNLLKGAIFLMVVWYFWFKPSATEAESIETRQRLVATLVAMIVGIIAARLLANLLPFRVRPVANPELHFRLPNGATTDSVASWSAFPSDHAVVWFTLAFGVLRLSRPLGAAVCAYACFLSFGRVFSGFHHPTDILAAAALSAALLSIVSRESIRSHLYHPIAWMHREHPGLFHGAAFLATYEIANLFDEVRELGEPAKRLLLLMT